MQIVAGPPWHEADRWEFGHPAHCSEGSGMLPNSGLRCLDTGLGILWVGWVVRGFWGLMEVLGFAFLNRTLLQLKDHCAVWSAQAGDDPVMFVASQARPCCWFEAGGNIRYGQLSKRSFCGYLACTGPKATRVELCSLPPSTLATRVKT